MSAASRLDRRRAVALGRLAAAYARHLARRAVRGRPRGGLERFAELYGPDRITAVTAAERELLPAQGTCIGCGLCGFAAPRAGYLRADRLPGQLTRSLPDLWTVRGMRLGGVDWGAGASVCPIGVPLDRISPLIETRLHRDGTAAPPPPRPPELPATASR